MVSLARRPVRTQLFRIVFLIVTIVFALYQLRAEYYELDPWLVQKSPYGFLALAYYELGQYARASRAWRAHYERSGALPLLEIHAGHATGAWTASNAEDLFERADVAFVAHDFTQATSIYRTLLRTRPGSVDAMVGLASALILAGDHAGSLSLWETVLNRGVTHQRTTIFLEFFTALEDLDRGSSHASAHQLLARTYAYRYLAIFDRRALGRVLTAADDALRSDSTLAGAHVSKGVVHAKWADYSRALDELTQAAMLRPTADTYERIAGVAGYIGRLGEELEAYKEAVRLEPDNPRHTYRLGDVLLNKYGDLHQANEYLARAYRLFPADRSIAVWYAYSLDRLQRHEEAIDIYDAIIRRGPRDQEARELKARCLVALERYQEVIDLLAASGSGPLSFHGASTLGYAYLKMKELGYAVTAYETANRLKPYDTATLDNLQALYRRQGRYQEAYEAVREILRIDPSHSGAQRVLPYLEQNRPR